MTAPRLSELARTTLVVSLVLALAPACDKASAPKATAARAGSAAAPLPAALPPPAALEPWMQTTLTCIVTSTIEHMNASEAAHDVASMALTTQHPRPYRHLRHWITAFSTEAARSRGALPRVTDAELFALAAVAHAELGDLRTARDLADRVLAAAPTDRGSGRETAVRRALEVLAWSGDAARATALVDARLPERIMVASGLARGGDPAGARKVLSALATEIASAHYTVRGLAGMAHVYAGDLVAARALIEAERDPEQRAMLYVWAADAAVRTKLADGASFVDAAIGKVMVDAKASTERLSLAKIAWLDLVKARDQLDGERGARMQLHAWLGDPAVAREHVDLFAFNVVRAEVAGMSADADAMLATLPTEYRTRAELDVALVRGNFERVFELLATHRRERAAQRTQDPGLDSEIVAGIDAVEVDLWLAFTDAPRAPAQVATFQAFVCP